MFTEPTISCLHTASVGNLVRAAVESYQAVIRLQSAMAELDHTVARAPHPRGATVRYNSKHLVDLSTDDLQHVDGLLVTPMLAWSRTTEFDVLKPPLRQIRRREEVLKLASALQLMQSTSVTLIVCNPQIVSHLPSAVFAARSALITRVLDLGRKWSRLLAHLSGELNMQRVMQQDNRSQDTVRVIEAIVTTDSVYGEAVTPSQSALQHAPVARTNSNDMIRVVDMIATSHMLNTFDVNCGGVTMNLSLALAQTLTSLRTVGCYRLPAYFHGLFNESTKTWVRAIAFNLHSSIVYDVLADRLFVYTASASASDIRDFVTQGLSCSPAQPEESAQVIMKYVEVQTVLSYVAAL